MLLVPLNQNININTILTNFSIKKQYLKKLKKQSFLLDMIKQKNYKLINQKLLSNKAFKLINDHVIFYIIDITFTKSNTFLHIMDSSGKLKFYSSAGHLKHAGKNKKFRINVLKSFYRVLITKLKFLKDKPIALHLKNVGFNKFGIIKKLKAKFFIKTVKIFNLFPFNGCRKKKVRRKK
jgi:ribosomal protein S11